AGRPTRASAASGEARGSAPTARPGPLHWELASPPPSEPAANARPGRSDEMADAVSVSGAVAGTDKTLIYETGKLAGQADGAVTVRIGDTVVLVTATASKSAREGAD